MQSHISLLNTHYKFKHVTNPVQPDLSNIKGKLPLLGVCFGAQYLAHFYGGEVGKSNSREYGRANLDFVDNTNPLFKGISKTQTTPYFSRKKSVCSLFYFNLTSNLIITVCRESKKAHHLVS